MSRVIRRTTAVLLGTGVLLSALSASASQQAIVEVTYKNQYLFGTTFTLRTAMGAHSCAPGCVPYMTVNTATTPTPSVMWPAGVLSGKITLTFSGTYTPFGSSMTTFMLKAGTVAKSHGGAAVPTTMTPNGLSIEALVPATSTTKCFASIPPAAPGPPALPGSCAPRKGSGMRVPGAKRYGGAARLLRTGDAIGTFVAFSPPGLDQFSIHRAYTPALTGPGFAGNYGQAATGTWTNTVLATARNTNIHHTTAPLTTGLATAMGGDFGTQLTYSGSHSFNTTNLTGMISMVQPFMANVFNRNQAGNFVGNSSGGGAVRTFSITFLPEPGVMFLLGCGALGLAGLAALRRR